MNGETLFRALSDVGDDLLEKARTKTFINPWRKWGKTAACLALVLCLTALVLPHFPRGCGSTKGEAYPQEAPAVTEDVETPETMPEEMKPESAPEESADSAGVAEDTEKTEGAEGAVVPITFRYESRTYVLADTPLEAPVMLGEDLGRPEDWTGRDLSEGRLYRSEDPDVLYVELSDGIYEAVVEP